ncbi:hypothetical protein GCM10029964_060500 [Kibdelosporangium lantanae]
MRFRGVMTIVAIICTTTMAASPVRAVPSSPDGVETCSLVAWGHDLPIVCGSNYLNADWNGDKIRDEVFFVSRPNFYIYRISAASNGPVRVSNGVATTMDTYEIRPSGAHRIYALTAGGRRYYSQSTDFVTWSGWEPYVPLL